jgi:hypothetical protein
MSTFSQEGRKKMGSASTPMEEVDVLLVGAGFGAFTMLNK